MKYRILLWEWGIGGNLTHHMCKYKEAEYMCAFSKTSVYFLSLYCTDFLAICFLEIVVNVLVFFLDNPTIMGHAVSECK